MKKILIIIATLILILSFSKVKASTFTSRQQQEFYIYPDQFTYESNSGFYIKNVTNNPHYVYFNSNYNLASGMNLATDAKYVYFTMRFRTSPLNTGTDMYNNYSVGVYYNKGDLTWCESVQSENYNINNQTYTNEVKITYKCPVITGAQHLSVIYVNGHDYSSSTTLGWQIGINPNFTVEIDSNDQGIQGVINQQEQTNDLLNETTQYNTNVNPNTKGANETIQAGAMEDQLIQENEFNGSILDGMSINSGASGFIWQIMERLRGMNIAIVSLMTMALGLGVIKLVLNR